jgi:hypothetical protein
MLDVAIHRLDGTTATDLGGRTAPPLPVCAALAPILPGGLRRGSTISVTGSISLLLALLGAASADGAWCALVGFPRISAEAACEYGVDLSRLAIVPAPGAQWTTVVGALLDALDVVATWPLRARTTPGDVRRLAARVRRRDAVLVPFSNRSSRTAPGSNEPDGGWPGADVRLHAAAGPWSGIGNGCGRLRARRVDVHAEGRGPAARPRSATLWLPAAAGGAGSDTGLAPVVPLARAH